MKRIWKMAILLPILMGLPAQAHTETEHREWMSGWVAEVTMSGLSPRLIAEYQDWRSRHPLFFTEWQEDSSPSPQLQKPRSQTPRGKASEGWRELVTAHFPADQVDTALRIIQCESNGDPGARNGSSGASGLFQVMPFWADHFGVSRESLFDPETNAEIARKVWDEQWWYGWSCYK